MMINQLEAYIVRHVKQFDPRTYYRLQSVPGIGQVLALVILYEVGDISRFPTRAIILFLRAIGEVPQGVGG
jgi:transposase